MSHRRLALALSALALALTLSCTLTVAVATARGGPNTRWWHSPIMPGGHMLSLGLIPCGPAAPGKVIIAYNAFISSRYPPPGIYLPTAAPCP